MTRRTVLKGLVGAGIGAATGAGSYGYLYARHRLLTTHAAVPVSGLPEALHGLRVGLITDLHRSRSVGPDLIAHAVELVSNERPDLIVLGGDYVTFADQRFMEPAAEQLAPLHAPHGVYAILGNHDDDRAMPAALQRHRIAVLRDARTRLAIRGEALELVGLRFWTRRLREIAALLRGAVQPVVLLAHDPRRLIEAAALDVPLVLSGHTHGGQVVLPGLGAVAARRFPVAAGFAHRENTTLFVSRGVGTVFIPVRLNCPPEVAILTLVRKSRI